jgi:YD repeat-containing protein
VITVTPDLHVTVQVQSDAAGDLSPIINAFDFHGGTSPNQVVGVPRTLKFGFAGATGAAMDAHEIRNVVVQASPPVSQIVAADKAANSPSTLHNPCVPNGHYPVNCDTGDFWHTFDDFSIPGRGVPLHLSRTYDSLNAGQNGPLGFGWTDSYSMSLTTDATGVITVGEEGGTSVSFAPLASGGYEPPSNVLASLVENTGVIATYTFTRNKDQIHYTFAAPSLSVPGHLLYETDRNAVYTTTLGYTGSNLTTITDTAGRALTLTYTGSHITGITDPAGRSVSFGYAASTGDLTTTTDVAGGVTQFTYDGSHHLLTMTDPRGNTVTNQYDGTGRVIQQTDPANRMTTYSYLGTTGISQTTTITDARGYVTLQQYQDGQLITMTKGLGTPSRPPGATPTIR